MILQSGMDVLVHKHMRVGLEAMSDSCCVGWWRLNKLSKAEISGSYHDIV